MFVAFFDVSMGIAIETTLLPLHLLIYFVREPKVNHGSRENNGLKEISTEGGSAVRSSFASERP